MSATISGPSPPLCLQRRHSRKHIGSAGLLCGLAGALAIALRLLVLPVLPVPVPQDHDEFSYLLGADTFASGRLANPPHPMWVHFETMHVNMRPTYHSKYFPGQALFLGFGQKVFGHPWAGVCLSLGVMFAALCWMLEGWVRPRFAFATTVLGILTWGLTSYWMNSYWGGAVAATGGALVIGAVPRLAQRTSKGAMLAAAIGIALLGNSRPFEGGLTVLSAGAVLLWWMRREKRPWRSLLDRRALLPFALVMLATIAAMGYYNLRTTGSPTMFPYALNEKTYSPSPRFFFLPLPPEPAYRHEEIRKIWEWDRDLYFRALRHPFDPLDFGKPKSKDFFLYTLMGLAALVGLIWGRRPETVAALAILPLPILGVLAQKAMLPHYFAPAMGAYLVLAAAGLERAASWKPPGVAIFAGFAVAMCFYEVSDEPRKASFRSHPIKTRPEIVQRLEKQGGRHLILVRYSPAHDLHQEWIYNRADIDGSSVVWAHDMGPEQNRELLDYYRDRKLWLFQPDADPPKLTPLEESTGSFAPPLRSER